MHRRRSVTEPHNLDQKMYKMVFVVNTSLSMGIGKVAAQVNETVQCIKQLRLDLCLYCRQATLRQAYTDKCLGKRSNWNNSKHGNLTGDVSLTGKLWCILRTLSHREKKIVLKGTDHTHLFALQEKANSNSLQAYIVSDAGHTQIPAGSVTVLSIFGEEDDVNNITGDLQLL